jgi:TrmH family RNA methyltransferase
MDADASRAQRLLPSEPALTLIRSLTVERRVRDASRCFFVEGVRNFIQAVERGWAVETLLYSERLLIAPVARQWVRRLKRAGTPYARVTPEQFRSVSRTERACGVGVVLRQALQGLDQLQVPERSCWIAVELIRTPGNLGTLMRTAQAVGCAGLIFIGSDTDPFDPWALRASMGSVFGLTLVRTTPIQLRAWTRLHGVQVVGASPEAETPFTQVRYAPRVVLMLGEERGGLSREQRALCDRLVHIPVRADVDSLNVGVAGSVLLYEILRVP